MAPRRAPRPLIRLRGILLALLMLAPFAAAAAVDIRPGDLYNDVCTLNFVFDGLGRLAGKVYVGTAAHCVDGVGESASTPGSDAFGRVVYAGDFADDINGVPGLQLDFALVEVDAAFEDRVRADVLGHPGMPTGHTTSATTATGDVLRVSGWGFGYDATSTTRENRTGLLMGDDARTFLAQTMAVPGDSGGPILHADGRALGVVSAFAFFATPPATDEGPTVEGILAELAALGFPVKLRTA